MLTLVLAVLSASPYVSLSDGVLYAEAPQPTLYAVAQPTGVEAIDARTGTIRWHDRDAVLPLVVRGGALLVSVSGSALHPRPRLVALDLANGKRLFELSVPERIAPLLVNPTGPGTRSSVSSFREGDDDFIHAETMSCYAGGAARTNPPPCQSADATVRIDWKARAAMPADAKPPAARQQQIQVPPNKRPTTVRTASGATGVAVQENNGDVRYRPPSGSDVVLVRRAGHSSLWPTLAVDGAAIVGFGQQEGGADSEQRFTYDAAFFDAETGAPLGTCAVHETPMPFLLRGKRVFYVWARHLAALDLTACRTLYRRRVRDLEYRGPMPP